MTRRRRPPSRSTPVDVDEWDRVCLAGSVAGLDFVGSTSATVWTATRGVLESRRAEGLAGAMAFTYRSPARSSDPTRILRNATSLAVGARSYVQAVPDAPTGRVSARVARYATADHYGRLRVGLDAVAGGLRELGFRAVVMTDDNSLVDREAAWRAGIGWYGRNSLILAPGAGSYLVLGAVVTDAVLPSGRGPVTDGCGSCTRCVTACPTGAIVASGVVDARRCLAWLLQAPGPFPLEFREALGDRIYGCDDCQEICPPNRARESRTARGDGLVVENDPGSWIDVIELLALDDVELLERCDRWYIPGRDVSIVRRNLLVVLGNSRTPSAPGVPETLARYLGHSDPLLAEHASWAAHRLGLGDLVDVWRREGSAVNNGAP